MRKGSNSFSKIMIDFYDVKLLKTLWFRIKILSNHKFTSSL